jgi:hypothetical protein
LSDTVKNRDKPARRVSHTSLRRVSENSPFRSFCPACGEGFLLVRRDQESFALLSTDRCTSCGQLILYTDSFIHGEPLTHPAGKERMTTEDDHFEKLGEEIERRPLGNPLAGRSPRDIFFSMILLMRLDVKEVLGFVLVSNGVVRSFIRRTHDDPRWIMAAKAIVSRLQAAEPKTLEDIQRFSSLEDQGGMVYLSQPMLAHEYWPT